MFVSVCRLLNLFSRTCSLFSCAFQIPQSAFWLVLVFPTRLPGSQEGPTPSTKWWYLSLLCWAEGLTACLWEPMMEALSPRWLSCGLVSCRTSAQSGLTHLLVCVMSGGTLQRVKQTSLGNETHWISLHLAGSCQFSYRGAWSWPPGSHSVCGWRPDKPCFCRPVESIARKLHVQRLGHMCCFKWLRLGNFRHKGLEIGFDLNWMKMKLSFIFVQKRNPAWLPSLFTNAM